MKVPKGLLRILTPLQRHVRMTCFWSMLFCDTMPQLLSIASRLFSLVQKQLAQTLNYSFPLTTSLNITSSIVIKIVSIIQPFLLRHVCAVKTGQTKRTDVGQYAKEIERGAISL